MTGSPDVVEVIFRFNVGDTVWVRDYRWPRAVKIVEATVREQHQHSGRHPWYPNGEGYSLDGELWWDCYPGCRIFATKEQAKSGRLPRNRYEAHAVARKIRDSLAERKEEREK